MEGHTEKDFSIEANNDTVREGDDTTSSNKTTNIHIPDEIKQDGILSTKDSIVDKISGEKNDKMEISAVNQEVQGKGDIVVESVMTEKLLSGESDKHQENVATTLVQVECVESTIEEDQTLLNKRNDSISSSQHVEPTEITDNVDQNKIVEVDGEESTENVVSDVLTGLIEAISNEDTRKAQDSMKKETEIFNNEETKLNKLAESVVDADMAAEGAETKILQGSKQIERGEAVQHDSYSEDDDSVGAFALLGKGTRKKKKKRKSKQSKGASLHIYEINKRDPLPSCTTKEKSTHHLVEVVTDHTDSIAENDCVDDTIGEEEDPLLFYSSAHEEQDPDYIEFHSSRLKRRLEAEMTMLQEEKNEDMQKVQAYIDAKGEERNASLQSEINRIRVSIIAKQTRQRTQLTEKHKKQIEADQNKIKDGERWLIEKQQQEMQARSEQHKVRMENQLFVKMYVATLTDDYILELMYVSFLSGTSTMARNFFSTNRKT